jgi:hypothetical protein
MKDDTSMMRSIIPNRLPMSGSMLRDYSLTSCGGEAPQAHLYPWTLFGPCGLIIVAAGDPSQGMSAFPSPD